MRPSAAAISGRGSVASASDTARSCEAGGGGWGCGPGDMAADFGPDAGAAALIWVKFRPDCLEWGRMVGATGIEPVTLRV